MATLFIYDELGPSDWGLISGKTVADEMESMREGEPINVRVNSIGGSVQEALAIRQLFKDWSGAVSFQIDAIAASAATFLAPDDAPVAIAEHGRVMIHSPITLRGGTAPELRKMADELDGYEGTILDIYEARSKEKATRAELKALMNAESLMTASEAHRVGLVDSINSQADRVAACWRPGVFSPAMDLAVQRALGVDQTRALSRQNKARAKLTRPTAADMERLARVRDDSYWQTILSRS